MQAMLLVRALRVCTCYLGSHVTSVSRCNMCSGRSTCSWRSIAAFLRFTIFDIMMDRLTHICSRMLYVEGPQLTGHETRHPGETPLFWMRGAPVSCGTQCRDVERLAQRNRVPLFSGRPTSLAWWLSGRRDFLGSSELVLTSWRNRSSVFTLNRSEAAVMSSNPPRLEAITRLRRGPCGNTRRQNVAVAFSLVPHCHCTARSRRVVRTAWSASGPVGSIPTTWWLSAASRQSPCLRQSETSRLPSVSRMCT